MSKIRTFPYYGGKASKLLWLMPLLSPPKNCTGFLDACCGSAIVALNWVQYHGEGSKIKRIVINDLRSAVYIFFKILRNRQDELIDKICLTPYSREEFNNSKYLDGIEDEVEIARRFFVIMVQGFGAKAMTGKDVSWSRSLNKTPPNLWKMAEISLRDVAQALQSIVIENKDAIEVIQFYGNNDKMLIYLDPPYPHKTRIAKKVYAIEQNDDWHTRLMDVILNSDAYFAISSYENELYNDYLHDWNMHRFSVITAFKSYRLNQDTNESNREEILYTNYPHQNNVRSLLI